MNYGEYCQAGLLPLVQRTDWTDRCFLYLTSVTHHVEGQDAREQNSIKIKAKTLDLKEETQ